MEKFKTKLTNIRNFIFILLETIFLFLIFSNEIYYYFNDVNLFTEPLIYKIYFFTLFLILINFKKRKTNN